MTGLWKTKIGGYIKDNRFKKTKFKYILKEKGRVLRKLNRKDIIDKNVYYEDRFEAIYKDNNKISYKYKEAKYGKCSVYFYIFDGYKVIEKHTYIKGYFDKNLQKWFVYNEKDITFKKYLQLKYNNDDIRISNVNMVSVKGIVELEYEKYRKINEENKGVIKKILLNNFNSKEFFYKKPVEHFDLMKLYRKNRSWVQKNSKEFRKITKSQINNLVWTHNLYTNLDDCRYYTFEELNPKFESRINM